MEQHDDTYNEQEVIVSVSGLYKSFDDNDVLKGIDMQVHKGKNVVVLGRSGSGKSVLIRIIAGLIKQDKGSVQVLGQEVSTLSKKDLMKMRMKMGFLFQSGALYDSLTVKENLEFPLRRHVKGISRREIDKAVKEALEAVDLPETSCQLPSELSGGQQKRIGIARMLISRPEIILYDEPTAGLDPITSVEVNKLINKVKEQYKSTSILITHDLTCAKQTGDSMMLIVNGKFTHEGQFDEIFSSDDKNIKGFYDYNFIL